MITLKAALIAASCVGAVAVGGGATWAMTGSHQDAGLQSGESKVAAKVRQAKDAVPSAAPTCLPAQPGAPKAGGVPSPKAKLPGAGTPKAKLPEAGTPKTPVAGATNVPHADLPTTPKTPKHELPKADVPNAPSVTAGKTGAPTGKPGVPSDKPELPTCVPSAKGLPKSSAPSAAPSQGVTAAPAVPAMPAAPAVGCDKLSPAVKVGGPVEKTVLLSKGLHYVSATPGSKELAAKKICAVTQKWTGQAGQWLTIERLKTPAQMTEQQLRQALKLPEGGAPVTGNGAGGITGRQAPGGAGVLVFDQNGYALLLNGSPALSGNLKDVAAALRQAK